MRKLVAAAKLDGRMVDSQPAHRVGADQAVDLWSHRGPHALEAGVAQGWIAGVAEPAAGGDIEVRVDRVAQQVARLADRARAEARSRPVGRGTAPGDAGDREPPRLRCSG